MSAETTTTSSYNIYAAAYLILYFAPHIILHTVPFYTLYRRNCKNVVGNDHEQGKDDACLSYLGGWDRSCNSYYDCWNSRLKGECEDCANSIGIGCGAKFDECKSSCMQSPIEECKAECDVCFCESDDPDDPEAALEECQAIGADCCKDPYGQLILLSLFFFSCLQYPLPLSPLLMTFLLATIVPFSFLISFIFRISQRSRHEKSGISPRMLSFL